MPKYEIMLILDPKEDVKKLDKITKEVFNEDIEKEEKIEKKQFAYPINNSSIGTYVILNVETNSSNIKEFTRKVNLQKFVWRILTLNLDAEKGKRIKSEIAAKKAAEKKPFERKRFRNSRMVNKIQMPKVKEISNE